MPERRTVVLMADDDDADVYTTRRALRKAGVDVHFLSVSSGGDLLRYLRQEGEYADEGKAPRPDVILLDINMPRMSGFEALTEIRGDSALDDIAVVMLTTSSDERDISRSDSLGASAFLSKPASGEVLERTLASVLP